MRYLLLVSEIIVSIKSNRVHFYRVAPKITYVSDSSSTVYKPFESDRGKFDIEVRVMQYAFLKDGRTVIIEEIIEAGKLYKGRDINEKELPEIEVKHEEISSLADEICKAVTVE